MELRTLLFQRAGEGNTDATLAIARERAIQLGIGQVVVASSRGHTARKAHALLSSLGIEIIVVTNGHGWKHKGWCMAAKTIAKLREMGMVVHTGVHSIADDVATAFSLRGGGRASPELVRDTLFLFGQGMKVAVECVLMAADAGLLDMSREVISLGGTHRGVDTAIVCRPAYARAFHQLRILEILAKPR